MTYSGKEGMGMGMMVVIAIIVIGLIVYLVNKYRDCKNFTKSYGICSADTCIDGYSLSADGKTCVKNDVCGENQVNDNTGACVCIDGFSFESDDSTTCVEDAVGIDVKNVGYNNTQIVSSGVGTANISHDDYLPYKDGAISKGKQVIISDGTYSATMVIKHTQLNNDTQLIFFTEQFPEGITFDKYATTLTIV